MTDVYLYALIGGLIIGLAVTVMLLFNGRVTGISGIINGALYFPKGDTNWRLTFILGLFAGGVLIHAFYPEAFQIKTNRSLIQIVCAGFIVGFGTIMGSGCTSGHGVCGISRLSIRSIVATLSFIISGVITSLVIYWLSQGGGQ
jgi:uncharacterized membrane protein YedE/YeeE